MKRWVLFVAGVAVSVLVTAVLWALGIRGFFLALLFPLLLFPFGARGGGTRTCNQCGYETMHPAVRYCPHDGTRME